MKISYIIPAYNEEKYIGPCIESILSQETVPHEIIVVDNNSQDSTADIVKQYPSVILLKEPKQGMIHARNTGMNHATGDVLARIDADTVLFPQWGTMVSQAFEHAPKSVAAVTGPGWFYDIAFSKFFSLFQQFFYFGIVRACIGMVPLWGSNMAIRKDVWKEIFPRLEIDERKAHEDIDITLKMKGTYTTVFVPSLRPYISARRFKDGRSLYEYPKKFITMYYFQRP